MFKLIHRLPNKVVLACSGGIDSMAAFHWLLQGNKLGGVIHVNHGTGEWADEAEELVYETCKELGIDFGSMRILDTPPQGASKEDWWRQQRLEFFKTQAHMNDMLVATAHNLNDCVEEYVINTMIRGRMGTIPYAHGPIIRPFRTWSREDILSYAVRNHLVWRDDPSNLNVNFLRNRIRHQVLPQLHDINLGLKTIVRRMVECEGLD